MDTGDDLVEDRLFQALPLPVARIQPARDLLRLGRVFRQEQSHGIVGGADPAGCVDPGDEGEGGNAGVDDRVAEARRVAQGLQAHAPVLVEKLEADAGEDPVFVHQGGQVADRPEGHEIEVVAKVRIGAVCPEADVAQPASQGDQEVEDDSDAGKMLEGEGAVAAIGVDDGRRSGQRRRHLVMVQDDRVDALCAGVFDFLPVRHPAVDRDDQPDLPGLEPVDGRAVQAVSLVHPVGNVVHHAIVDPAQKPVQDRQGGDSVGIVIAVDRNRFLPLDRADHARNALLHVLHEERAVQVVQRGVQESPGGREIGDAAVDENLGNDGVELEFFHEKGLDVRIRFREFPSCNRQHRTVFIRVT